MYQSLVLKQHSSFICWDRQNCRYQESGESAQSAWSKLILTHRLTVIIHKPKRKKSFYDSKPQSSVFSHFYPTLFFRQRKMPACASPVMRVDYFSGLQWIGEFYMIYSQFSSSTCKEGKPMVLEKLLASILASSYIGSKCRQYEC